MSNSRHVQKRDVRMEEARFPVHIQLLQPTQPLLQHAQHFAVEHRAQLRRAVSHLDHIGLCDILESRHKRVPAIHKYQWVGLREKAHN